ncbi:MAG: response regulator [Deltaproteobacteria bacterium]
MNNILVVDDDLHMRMMFEAILESEGYNVTLAQSGPEALAMMKAEQPSLVLLDYMMPGMNGLDVLKEIKKSHVQTEVIIVTGHGSEKLSIEMLKSGASDYIQKPFTMDQLLSSIKRVLSVRTEYDKNQSEVRILAVDDDRLILSIIEDSLKMMGEVVTSTDPRDVLSRMRREHFDILLTDIYMPQMDGIELLKKVKVLSPSTSVIVITSSGAMDLARKALKEGASDYIMKPLDPEDLRASMHEIIAAKRREAFNRLNERIEMQEQKAAEQFEFTLEVVEALIVALEARDPYTRGHSERVTDISVGIGMEMGLPIRDIGILRHSARLHDLGKIGTEDVHLYKTGSLKEDEMTLMARHPEIGCNILKSITLMAEYIPGIRHHHERYDGMGYPDGLKGDEIPLVARIISVADAFDAMTTSRPYREAMKKEDALEELEKNKGVQFDSDVIDAFLTSIRKE